MKALDRSVSFINDVSLIGVQITAMIINQFTGHNNNGDICVGVLGKGGGGLGCWTLNQAHYYCYHLGVCVGIYNLITSIWV